MDKPDEGIIHDNNYMIDVDIEKGDCDEGEATSSVANKITKALSSYLSDATTSSTDGLLVLPRRVPPQTDSVPIMCAICFETYKPGDTVAWSNNNLCIHCFHLDCVIAYLVMVRGRRIPCPTCRQTFTTLTVTKKSKGKQSTR